MIDVQTLKDRAATRQGAANAANRLITSIGEGQRATLAVLKRLNEECCDERGDDQVNRAALLADCESLDGEQHADLTVHFAGQAALWRSTRGLP